MSRPKILAYYLPQFHEIKENNEWWGDGFTEWSTFEDFRIYSSVQKIRSPIEPYYKYSLPSLDVMEWQAKVAKKSNIEGFLLWDYWFGAGKVLLEKPKNFIRDNDVDFPYALVWANHSWYNKKINKLLIEQKYLGSEDYKSYFLNCITHFKKNNYVKIDNKPVFGIYMPDAIPDLQEFMSIFDQGVKTYGYDGIYWIVDNTIPSDANKMLFDCIVSSNSYFKARKYLHPVNFIKEQLIKKFDLNFLGPIIYSYKKLVSEHAYYCEHETPVIFTGWDTTLRHKERGTILKEFDEQEFKKHLINVFSFALKNQSEVLILKSWNEWAEGNLIEPDNIFGYALLDTLREQYLSFFLEG